MGLTTELHRPIRKIGGYDISQAIGLSFFKTSQQFMRDYRNGVVAEENEAMRIGKRDEPKVRKCYAQEMNSVVRECGPVHHISYPEWMAVNPDGLVNEDGCIEIKCKQSNYKGVPIEHYCQMQYQMEFTNRNWCDYVVKYNSSNQIYVWNVARDKDWWDMMYSRLLQVYTTDNHDFTKSVVPEMKIKFVTRFFFTE